MPELPASPSGEPRSPEPAASSASLSRRRFLGLLGSGGALAALPAHLPGQAAPAASATAAAAVPASVVYLSLSPDEASFTESLVNVLCPADPFTPNGVDCGLALFIDRQLAGPFGRGDRLYRRGPYRPAKPELGYQLPLTPEEFYKAGVNVADALCQRRHQNPFSALSPADADAFLHALTAGTAVDPEFPLALWFNDLVYPLFLQACFADPVYGGNKDKAFWKLIGYPGLPAVNAENMLKYRGQPFPGARTPQSMEDFS